MSKIYYQEQTPDLKILIIPLTSVGLPLGIKKFPSLCPMIFYGKFRCLQNKETNSQCRINLNDKVISSSVRHTYSNKNDDKNYSLSIYHQNIHGLKGKINEFMLSIVFEMPHIICLSEHHLKYNEIDFAHIQTYKLGAKYCRTSLKYGGVCIYIHKI